jgi:hypothetical protein
MFSFILTIKIIYGSPTILTRRGEKEKIFWNSFIHSLLVFVAGGIFLFGLEENKSTELFNLGSMEILAFPENLVTSH